MAFDDEDYDMINGRLSEIESQLDRISNATELLFFDIQVILNAIFGRSLEIDSLSNMSDGADYEPTDLAQNLAQFVHDFRCSMYEISERNFRQMAADMDGFDE